MIAPPLWLAAIVLLVSLSACSDPPEVAAPQTPATEVKSDPPVLAPVKQEMKTATFGSGCFWCTEAVFQRMKGVEKVVSGYTGGRVKNPTYDEVCSGTTGHAEVVQVTYDPSVVSYSELLEVFWKTHDPTTLNRQGNDIGTQYRSAIFFHDDEQKQTAEKLKAELDMVGAFSGPIVTEIVPLTEFYPAEDYHQNYYNQNPGQGYCAYVVGPKVEKFKKVFPDKVKPGE